MARRRRRSGPTVETNPFDAMFSSPSLTPTLIKRFSGAEYLPEVEDRRQHFPDLFRPTLQTDGHPAEPVRVSQKPFKRNLPFGLQFAQPDKTVVCVRRNQRKEVLHALRKTGRGRGRRRAPKRNWLSGVRC